MKLDRNLNKDGIGKYALINLRKVPNEENTDISNALFILDKAGVIEWGIPGYDDEFFVIKLKDIFAARALYAYSDMASGFDIEWAKEVARLAQVAEVHPNKKFPD